jgi:hypothetical protein
MAVYKTKSSKTIIRKIFRDLKPDNDDNWIDDAIEWIGEASRAYRCGFSTMYKNNVY